jgi:two-component system response regulator DegU
MTFNSPEYIQPDKINVLLYASYRLILDSFDTLLSSSSEINVIASSSSIDKVPELLTRHNPSVAVLCFMENDLETIEIMGELQKINEAVKFLIISCSDDIEDHFRAVKLGAFGILYKNQEGQMLLRAVKQIAAGETWFNQKLIARILNDEVEAKAKVARKRNSTLDLVTKRELEIISLIAQGLRNKVIADKLYISEATVRHHLSSIYSKLGVEDRLNLVIYAYQNQIIN